MIEGALVVVALLVFVALCNDPFSWTAREEDEL